MKRSFESGHEKRKKLARQKEAASASQKISNFFAHPDINSNRLSQTQDLREINSSQSESTVQETLTTDTPTVTNVTENGVLNQENVIVQPLTIDNESYHSNNFLSNPSNIMRDVDIGAGSHSDPQFRRRFLNESYQFPTDVPNDQKNCRFPYRLLQKNLLNGETCKRDWIYWSNSIKAVFCASCWLSRNSSNHFINGWGIKIGGRKLKDKVIDHENSVTHKKNYLSWKNAVFAAKNEKSIDCHLMKELETEAEKWRKILKRILDVILFMAERGLAFFGSSHKIGDTDNGNFLGIVELLSKYDPVLNEHLSKVRDTQEKGVRMQTHYLSSDIVNEFIDICGKMVKENIVQEVERSKYFGIVADGTPDISHQEQISLIVRYIKTQEDSIEVKERFLKFLDFNDKHAEPIAAKILETINEEKLDFQNCSGGSFDNAATMSGKNNGVQAHLKNVNQNFIFIPCGNHTLNLVGNDAAESCFESTNYFGMFQKVFNFFSGSPSRWEILKLNMSESLHSVSTTRWTARFKSAKPIVKNLDKIIKSLEDVAEKLNLPPQLIAECNGLKKYLSTFETVLMNNIWIHILTKIDHMNSIVEARGATLDVEMDNLNSLRNSIESMKFDEIIEKSKEAALKFKLSETFTINRKCTTQEKAEDFYRKVFNKILSTLTKSLSTRFSAIASIVENFEFLWQFNSMSDDQLKEAATRYTVSRSKDISPELVEEMIFLKEIHKINFKLPLSPKNLLREIVTQNLVDLFPNVFISLRIFMTLPISAADAERSFSNQKRTKNYLRSTMGQQRLNGLAMLSINSDIARTLNYQSVIEKFVALKIRRMI
jgi:hypothetical protein